MRWFTCSPFTLPYYMWLACDTQGNDTQGNADSSRPPVARLQEGKYVYNIRLAKKAKQGLAATDTKQMTQTAPIHLSINIRRVIVQDGGHMNRPQA